MDLTWYYCSHGQEHFAMINGVSYPVANMAEAIALVTRLYEQEARPRESGIGDTAWLMSKTGWNHDKVARLCRLKRVPGAFQAQRGIKGSMWHFRKAKTLEWLESIEVR
jgi:hypothetical protein